MACGHASRSRRSRATRTSQRRWSSGSAARPCRDSSSRTTSAHGGQRVEFAGIQQSGGSRETVRRGVEIGSELLLATAAAELRPPRSIAGATIGIELSHASPLADAFVQRAREAGASVVLGDGACALASEATPVRAEAFGGARAGARCAAPDRVGNGSQQHVALAAAGAEVIVAFTALDDAPVGFPICPVIAVAGSSDLHRAIGDDFDLAADSTVDALWSATGEVLAGAETAAESRSSRVFALERLAMCM